MALSNRFCDLYPVDVSASSSDEVRIGRDVCGIIIAVAWHAEQSLVRSCAVHAYVLFSLVTIVLGSQKFNLIPNEQA